MMLKTGIGPRTCRLVTFVLNRELHATGSCFDHHNFFVPIFNPDLKKPEVDLNKHDPEGKFTPAVREFIQARDYENSGGRKIDVVTFDWKDHCGTVEVNDYVFGSFPRIDILHRNMVWYQACIRAGTASCKTRGDVRGGAKKPWAQKGTGRARHGSRVDTTQRGGGRVKGPKPRDYDYPLPFLIRRMGLRAALSCKLAQGDLEVVEKFDKLPERASDFHELLIQNHWDNALLVDAYEHEPLYALTRELNLSEANRRIHTTHTNFLHVYGMLTRRKLVLSLNALRVLDEKLSDDGRVLNDERYRLLRQDTFDEDLLWGEYDPKRNIVIKTEAEIPRPKSKFKDEQKKLRKPPPKKRSKQLRQLEPYVDGKPPPDDFVLPDDSELPSTSIRGSSIRGNDGANDVLRVKLRSKGMIDI